MPSPFISVARRRSRLRQSSRLKMVAAVAMVALLAMVVPAVAAPHAFSSAMSPIAIAKKALKLATGANRTAKQALKVAKRAPADNSVTSRKIANGAVTGIKITNGSVSTADFSGADITGTIHGDAGAVAAHSCITAAITLGGAQIGDAAFLTFIGNVPAPPSLTFEIIKVSAPGQGTLRFCNPTNGASPAFSNVGIRIITFH
jgi:hypothetical protein